MCTDTEEHWLDEAIPGYPEISHLLVEWFSDSFKGPPFAPLTAVEEQIYPPT